MPERTKTDERLKGPLAGVRVIEMGQLVAGPFVGSRMADFGAEVIKVETPGNGDAMRAWGHHRYKERGLWWPVLARNKKSVSANLRESRGQDLVRRLIETADVLVENFKPGTLEKWGLAPSALHEINPGLVIARVSGYGQTGPYADRPGFASVGEAMGGLRYINGFPDQPPPRMGISLGDTLAGMFAAQGVLMALYWRDTVGKGRGQVIDASITESCFAMMESALSEYDKVGFVREPSGTGLANVSPSNIFPTSDGKWVVIAANLNPMFKRLCDAMEQPELADDPRYSTHQARGQNGDELDSLIADWTRELSAAELDERLDKHGVVSGPIYSIEDIVNDPHYQARDMICRFQDKELGEIAVPGFVPKLSETHSEIAWLGPSEVGAHNEEVYCGMLGLSEDDLKELENDGII
ncbi:MAG: formyl-CoA transferase [Proteobacteria bacterium]|jgi:crotonobetainyl-CoA:carnitine CoA-transferase CaiB-like acyl-CoA transferase|uniref:Formyl-CoA transferase n=1 Tax=marine metagenome TaxID=408172 RepID=A0A381YVZ6_9ZZZZ|nr:formyl-CoA transferase [Pseudomonadota bacterium]MBP11634.1 formyl-CoA transferase [Acidiferrobacteraceae bacterium]MDP6135171.1 CoA transferase [Arenicellales bacterium]HCF73099.1 formyl-CoA transferase [Gammaproteobacteria bacterium]MDP7219393.1 CoA transferase [Arenicellales bacterium]|tara:strand:- start:6085 stop:7317 length:1233 start_codon:yes stop_codon:yes gene_type:complete